MFYKSRRYVCCRYHLCDCLLQSTLNTELQQMTVERRALQQRVAELESQIAAASVRHRNPIGNCHVYRLAPQHVTELFIHATHSEGRRGLLYMLSGTVVRTLSLTDVK